MKKNKRLSGEILVPIIMTGAIWGIFEATVGYLLHLLPIRIGFLVWYPTAVFFLMSAYQTTRQKTAVLWVAVMASAIKLLNLMLPGRIDYVINPAVAILLESLAVFIAIYAVERIPWAGNTQGILLLSIGMNTFWRVLYLGYLAFLVPDWMREVSVLKSSSDLIRFMAIDHLSSSLVVFAVLLLVGWLAKYKAHLIYSKLSGFSRILAPAVLIALNITLQTIL